MAKNGPLGVAGLIMMGTSILFLFFIVLSGVTNSTPLRKTYFLRADTSGITGARDVTQWTYFYFCGENNQDCGSARAAPAFGKAWSSRPQNAPHQLVGAQADHTTSSQYFYMWRFGWVFMIITLFFEVLAFFSGFLACCGRLGSAIAALISTSALIISTVAMSLMTATFVKARDAFHSDNRSASVGAYAFGFAWGSWAALFIATMLYCIGMRGDRHNKGEGTSWGSVRRNRSGGNNDNDNMNEESEELEDVDEPEVHEARGILEEPEESNEEPKEATAITAPISRVERLAEHPSPQLPQVDGHYLNGNEFLELDERPSTGTLSSGSVIEASGPGNAMIPVSVTGPN
ncbi:SUR7/PalI family-domain-containing protein [Mariannaea sp. PMI_226]|nr:SUR7/PalI family-domain-containing protein [Mariannaea sp. PMI_226]